MNNSNIDFETRFQIWWLHHSNSYDNNINLFLDDAPKYSRQLRSLCELGHLDLAKWLFQNQPNKYILSILKYDIMFKDACNKGDLEVAKWILQIKQDVFPDVLDNRHNAFKTACTSNKLDIAKWIFQMNPEIDVSFNNNYPFVLSGLNGNIDFAEWLLQIKPEIYNSEKTFNEAFLFACRNDRFEYAKWIFGIKPNLKNADNFTFIFRTACTWNWHQKCELKKWLISIKPDIDIEALDVFVKIANVNINYVELAKYIQSLRPCRYVSTERENGKIYFVVRTDEEEKKEYLWNNRKYPVWIASNNSPNKNNLLYRLPNDLSREVIQYV